MHKLNLPVNQLEWRYYYYTLLQDERKISFDFRTKYEYHSEKRLIKITRENLLVNDEKPDETLIGNLIFQVSEALFSLVLQINSSGYPIAIFNHSEILERWKSFIPRFQEYYDNALSIKLLNKIGKLYRNPEKLLTGLQNDWFYSTFFFPVYKEYGNNESVELEYHFPSVFGNTTYKAELLLNEEKTVNGKTEISISGNSSNNENNKMVGNFLLNSDRSIHGIKFDFIFSDIHQNTTVIVQETKEISERKTGKNIIFDEQKELKESKSRGFFIEEIKDTSNFPKHK